MIHAFTDSPYPLIEAADAWGGFDPRATGVRRSERGGTRGPADEPGDDLGWFSLSLVWLCREGRADQLARLSLTGTADGPTGWRGGIAPPRWM